MIYCVSYDASPGDVTVHYQNNGRRVTETVIPTRSLEVLPGMRVNEHVVPFHQPGLIDSSGRRGAGSGFNFIARSSFRVAAASYGTRTLDLTMIFPINGGGIIRVSAGGQEWDIANPTFDPRAEPPSINQSYGMNTGVEENPYTPHGIEGRRLPDAVLISAYQRTHQGFAGVSQEARDGIEQRRQARLASFDLTEVGEDAETQRQGAAILTPILRNPARPGRVTVTGRGPVNQVESQESPSPLVVPISRPAKSPKTRLERLSEMNEED